jgi:ribulose bisphosphate carboxylase small subunit
MLESEQKIRIRVTDSSVIDDLKSVFETAKKKYAKVWGFDPVREQILNTIEIDRVTSVTNTYNPGDMGWRNE